MSVAVLLTVHITALLFPSLFSSDTGGGVREGAAAVQALSPLNQEGAEEQGMVSEPDEPPPCLPPSPGQIAVG